MTVIDQNHLPSMMKVPVQNRKVSRSRRPTLGLSLGFAVVVCVTIPVYLWADDYYAERIVETGGVVEPNSGLDDNLGRVWRAWIKQRAAATDAPPIPTLDFDLPTKNIGALAWKRDEAVRNGYLVQEADDYVPADIRVTNGRRRKKVYAKIRVKGDVPDHIKGDKWSFRVKVSGAEEVLGMRVFSIQHPKVNGYAHECLVLEHMRREGVLAPRYEFVRVVVNGRDKGIMALKEHFSKELLESQQRWESVIVRFDESLKWRTIVLMGQTVDFSAPHPLITHFQGAKVASTPHLARDLDTAVGLLRGFLSRGLAPSAVFDPEVTASAKLPLALPPTRGLAAPKSGRIELSAPEGITKVRALVIANIQGYPIDKRTQKTHTSVDYAPTATAPLTTGESSNATVSECSLPAIKIDSGGTTLMLHYL